MTQPPLVSAILPAFDAAPFVAEAVRSAHAQTHPRLELVAVDDGSADGTGEALEALAAGWTGQGRRMAVRRQPNAGAAAARNAALALATGEILVFLDADDRWHPDLVARVVAALADPGITLALPRWRYVDAQGRPIGLETAEAGRFGRADLLGDNPVHSATGVALRRETAERAGGFDPALRACIDLDLWVRALGRDGLAVVVPGARADYRRRPGQITGDWRRMERAWTRVHRKLAERGEGLGPADLARARGRACLFWSAAAYEAGDFAAARRLVAECWRRDPTWALRQPGARLRSLAAGATLLPRPWHDAIRARFNARSGGRPAP